MNREFEAYALTGAGIQRINDARKAFNDLLEDIIKIVPAGRELSIARTKLEEACFFAVKGISAHRTNQKNPVIPNAEAIVDAEGAEGDAA